MSYCFTMGSHLQWVKPKLKQCTLLYNANFKLCEEITHSDKPRHIPSIYQIDLQPPVRCLTSTSRASYQHLPTAWRHQTTPALRNIHFKDRHNFKLDLLCVQIKIDNLFTYNHQIQLRPHRALRYVCHVRYTKWPHWLRFVRDSREK